MDQSATSAYEAVQALPLLESGYWKTHFHHPTQPGYPLVHSVMSINSELGSKQHSIAMIS